MAQRQFHLRILGRSALASWYWPSVGDSAVFSEINAPSPPVFTVLPTISGSPEVGQTLSGSDGTVVFGTITARQWLRNGVPITDAIGSTYLLVVADDGADITFRNIASGDGGTVNGDSLPVGPVAEGLPGGLEIGATSLKFATGNLTAANQTSVIKQASTGLTDVLTADDSFMVIRAYFDFERMLRNSRFALAGNAVGPGRFRLVFTTEGIATAGERNRFAFAMRRSAGTQYSFFSGVMPSVSGWFDVWIRRTTGGVFTLDVFDMAGVKVLDGAASAFTEPLGGVNTFTPTHLYIGDAVDTASEATTATARAINGAATVGWEGATAFMYIGDAAVSDADCQAIALGADAVTRIGASAFKFARRFGMDATGAPTGLGPVAGTSDTTAAATVIGTFLPGGTPGRQGTTDFITLNPVSDYRGFGVDPVTLSATVPFAGNCGGIAYSGSISALLLPDYRYRREVRFFGGQVQGRFINENGTPVAAWQTVAATAATGITPGLTFTENSRSAPAIKVMVQGQSQMTIFGTGIALNNTLSDPAFSIARQERGTNNTAARVFQNRPELNGLHVSDGLVEFAEVIRAGELGAVQVVMNALQGSSVIDMIDDWSRTVGDETLDTEDLLTFAGNDVTVDLWQWYTTHQGLGSAFGTDILDAVYNGTGPNATANQLGNIRSASAKVVISPATRAAPTSAGPLDTDPNATIGAVRAVMRTWAAANDAAIGPEITDMKLEPGQGPHQDITSVRGNVRLGIRLGEAVLRGIGASTSLDPTIGTPQFVSGKAAITLEVTLPNAGSTLRVDDAATYASNVQGFEISTNGGSTWSRSGFTAAFSGTTVTLPKSSGDWSAVTVGQMQVRYNYGSPVGYGTSLESTELFRGGLYDGTALEGGIGLPVVPLGPTVVAEP